MKINWSQLRANIPEKVSIGKKHTFKIVWSDHIGSSKNGRPHYGETSYDPKEIRIFKDLDDKEAVKTFWHEYLHTFKLYKRMHLTESEVLAFENKFESFYEMFSALIGEK
jgi:hypothetical protein